MKKFENELYRLGYKNIAGLDEAGRGCWAGPLVVAICILDKNYINNEINDSKKINKNKRQKLFDEIINKAKIVDWIIFNANFVDKYNPKETSIIGMKKLINKHIKNIDYCLIDYEKIQIDNIQCKSITKGDQVSQTIAAASIIAKVIRDKIMMEIHSKYPNYNFDKHQGYGTKKHLEILLKNKPIIGIHRLSYKPIKKIIDKN